MPLWTPANDTVAGWWDFADAATVTTVSGAISQINDKSGNGYHLIQSTSGNRPTYQSAVLNGLNVGRFDGSNDSLRKLNSNDGLFQNVAGGTILAVRKATAITTSRYVTSISNSSAVNPRAYLAVGITNSRASAGGRQNEFDTTQNATSTNNASTTDFQLHIGVFDYANAILRQWIDGTNDGTRNPFQVAGVTDDTPPAQIVIGASWQLSLFFTGDIAEVIHINRALSTADRQTYEGYLAHKWGLTASLPADHPYKTTAPGETTGITGDITATYAPVSEFYGFTGISGDLVATYSPVSEFVGYLPDYGDVSQALDFSFVPPWVLGGDRVSQPITVRLTAFGLVEQPLGIGIVAPYGDLSQSLGVRFTGAGDISQALDIALRDPTESTTTWTIRARVGGVDISDRTTGEGSVRGEEGGARIASLVLVPEVGPIDAEAMSGQPVVIDFLMRSGGIWTSRRLFTGKVDEPVWDVSRGTLALSCTDDLQNRVAALSRSAIDAITGGRFHIAVQGEQSNNWDYSQAVMETVAGSLDADAYGALRVTPWHSTAVWNTYTLANTEQDSIYFTLPTRTSIINKVTGTFEYRFTRLHRRTATIHYNGDMEKTVHYGLPLLARATVEAALQGSGWNFFYGGSAIGPGGGGSDIPLGVTDGQPVTPNIDYTPYPESYDIPSGGMWYQKEVDTTCLGFRCSMWRRWAQTVTETYVLTVTAPESIAANGVLAREDRASLASDWDASSWESDPTVKPSLPITGKTATLDYAPDAGTADRDEAIATFLDTLKVQIDSTHRGGRGGARTWLTPEIDTSKRLRVEKGSNVGEGKVVSFEHAWDQAGGSAMTSFEIAITRHGAVGITPPVDTPSEAPAAPEVPAVSSYALAGLYDVPKLHIGALADSPPEDEEWTGWIVNVPASYNVDDPGSTEPSINPETQKTERSLVNNPYRGGTTNPLYRADKAYSKTGFRVRLPAVEEEARDSASPMVKASYTLAIVEDDFNLTA